MRSAPAEVREKYPNRFKLGQSGCFSGRPKKTGEEKWGAYGDVVIRNVIKQERMETDTLYWDQAKHEIFTHCYVKMSSPQGYMQGYGMRSDEMARNAIILRPFDSYGLMKEDSTLVRIDSANFIGPLLKK